MIKPILQTIDLKMVYHVGKVDVQALRGVDLEIGEGEYVAIMGPSGCGKSTLLHIIGGMLQPTSGRVIIGGEDLTAMNDAQRTDLRRRKIGFVFQRFNLFPTLTAEGNLKLAERIYTSGNRNGGNPERRRDVLRLLKLEDKINHKPLELSGGEQQRVAIARAIINRPAILLADEPTGNLDSENSQIVLDMIRDLNLEFGQTIVMITHNPEAAQRADRIIEMRDGHIVGISQPVEVKR
ncbi:MAG TPA: ABC transporter ATP-binding protein [Blastocatellia bacterium]|nr:ABC transporter ATP-binding protein [Blastocatellia bacterium]